MNEYEQGDKVVLVELWCDDAESGLAVGDVLNVDLVDDVGDVWSEGRFFHPWQVKPVGGTK